MRGITLDTVTEHLASLGCTGSGAAAAPDLELSAYGVVGVVRYALIAQMESAHGLSFPPELIESLATFDDLLHYLNTKVPDA